MKTVIPNEPSGTTEASPSVWPKCLSGNPPTRRERFLAACHCIPLDYPPLWLMRQAGRVLPEYRALKEKHTFLELVQTPELAMEVTMQPIRRFGFDGAIIFSDILVVPEALGQGYSFRDQGGVQMSFPLNSAADIDRLDTGRVVERLQYVAQALKLVRGELGNRTALLGFAGSPWTLANFMLEGGSAREYSRARELFYSEPALFERLFEKLTDAVVAFLQLQIDAGADVIQIFDSLGGLLAESAFEEASCRWMREIISRLGGQVPVILFSKGTHGNWPALAHTGAQVLSVDWTMRLAEIRARLPEEVGVQGNLDPVLLQTRPEVVTAEVTRILEDMRGHSGHIFNLGHGVHPNARLENIEALVNTVRNFK